MTLIGWHSTMHWLTQHNAWFSLVDTMLYLILIGWYYCRSGKEDSESTGGSIHETVEQLWEAGVREDQSARLLWLSGRARSVCWWWGGGSSLSTSWWRGEYSLLIGWHKTMLTSDWLFRAMLNGLSCLILQEPLNSGKLWSRKMFTRIKKSWSWWPKLMIYQVILASDWSMLHMDW